MILGKKTVVILVNSTEMALRVALSVFTVRYKVVQI